MPRSMIECHELGQHERYPRATCPRCTTPTKEAPVNAKLRKLQPRTISGNNFQFTLTRTLREAKERLQAIIGSGRGGMIHKIENPRKGTIGWGYGYRVDLVPNRVECPCCGKQFDAVGLTREVVPGHSERWKTCPGSYRNGTVVS